MFIVIAVAVFGKKKTSAHCLGHFMSETVGAPDILSVSYLCACFFSLWHPSTATKKAERSFLKK